mgnify:CR=1 FL=1
MNNRYICKGKRKDNGEWVEGNLINCAFFNDDGFPIFYILDTDNIEYDCWEDIAEEINYLEVIPKTVGQCSGVPDKNGTLMYEGDIVKGLFDFGLEIMSVCTFKDGAFGLTAKQCGAYHFSAFTSICNVKYEVIGNIHDNPNLLKIEHDSLCETETYKAGDEE